MPVEVRRPALQEGVDSLPDVMGVHDLRKLVGLDRKTFIDGEVDAARNACQTGADGDR